MLHGGERFDEVNENLRLIQKTDGLTFGTDAFLLSAYAPRAPRSRAIELGCGTGIVALLCAARGQYAHIDAVEIQPDFAELATRNAALTGWEGKITVRVPICASFGQSISGVRPTLCWPIHPICGQIPVG